MNKFNALMDDLKASVEIAVDNKGLFLPGIIKIAVNIVLIIVFVILFLVLVIGGISIAAIKEANVPGDFVGFVAALFIFYLIIVLVVGAVNIIFNTGTIYMVKKVLQGEKATKANFFEGVKKYFFTVFGTNVLLIIAFIILSVFIVVALAIYLIVAGVLTGGVALVVLPYLLYPLLGTWVIIAIEKDISGIEGIKEGFVIGKKHYVILLLLFYLTGAFTAYIVGMGGLLSLVIMPVVGAVLPTYFNISLMLQLRRYYGNETVEYM